MFLGGFRQFLCLVTGMLIRFVVHAPSPADTGFPDIDPHRAGAQSTPYFAPFAGANHPSHRPPYVRAGVVAVYRASWKTYPHRRGEHAKQDLPLQNPAHRHPLYMSGRTPHTGNLKNIFSGIKNEIKIAKNSRKSGSNQITLQPSFVVTSLNTYF